MLTAQRCSPRTARKPPAPQLAEATAFPNSNSKPRAKISIRAECHIRGVRRRRSRSSPQRRAAPAPSSAPLAFSISVAWFRRQDPVLPRKMRSVRWDLKQLALALPCGGSRSIWYSGNGGFHHSMGLISLGPASGGFRTASAASGGAVAGAPVHLAFSLVHCLRRFALHLAQ